jgi:hypothetical protein
MGAGWGIVDGAIGRSPIVVVCARRRLSKVLMSTRGRSLWWAPVAVHRSVMGPRGRSSMVVVGGRSHSSMMVVGPCR